MVSESIAAEIKMLNANRTDLHQRGRRAREAFERHYTLEAMAVGIEQVYEQLFTQNDRQLKTVSKKKKENANVD
jgi:hypothetical protein